MEGHSEIRCSIEAGSLAYVFVRLWEGKRSICFSCPIGKAVVRSLHRYRRNASSPVESFGLPRRIHCNGRWNHGTLVPFDRHRILSHYQHSLTHVSTNFSRQSMHQCVFKEKELAYAAAVRTYACHKRTKDMTLYVYHMFPQIYKYLFLSCSNAIALQPRSYFSKSVSGPIALCSTIASNSSVDALNIERVGSRGSSAEVRPPRGVRT